MNSPRENSLSQWVHEAPDEPDRAWVKDQMMRASKTGFINLSHYNLSSLPPIPDGVKEVKISNIRNLRELPSMPAGVEEIHVEDCPGLKISNLPRSTKKMIASNVKEVINFPDGLKRLNIGRCNSNYSLLPPIPDGVEYINVYEMNSLCELSLPPEGVRDLIISDCENLKISNLPPGIERMIVRNVKEVIEFPRGVKELEIDLSSVPELPEELASLELSGCKGMSTIGSLPDGLEKLKISRCKDLILPSTLPGSLSHLSVIFQDKVVWDISENEFPLGMTVSTYNVELPRELYGRGDVLFGNIHSEASLKFNPGDLVFGLSPSRAAVVSIARIWNGAMEKDILSQNILTDAVWDHGKMMSRQYRSDDEIKSSLNDAERGIEFKNFLQRHERYDVTNLNFWRLSEKELLAKTSKAGLEFQTKVRGGKVIFCVDNLLNVLPQIVDKDFHYGEAITAHELRWLYRNREDESIKENVIFSLGGKIVSHDTVFSHEGWGKYSEKHPLRKAADG
ncbi:hypothetical protein [Burkholderia sp. BE17]|uniref:hypothetical protein n=1 Tax=Burkholderia sp. BE17 TaxID=2656644 RepID=UPI00128BAA44|nr:hypothetical protein [Burkholderia sp. BE17]MPV71488.1 hypothetical protein [Burkholderia sp. BE17]